jgi:hypothetical protein
MALSTIAEGCYAVPHYAECRLCCVSQQALYAECDYAECRYSECRYAECHYAECHYAECRGTFLKAIELEGPQKKFLKNLIISCTDN